MWPKKMADRDRDFVLKHFTLTHMIDRTEQVYMELLNKKDRIRRLKQF